MLKKVIFIECNNFLPIIVAMVEELCVQSYYYLGCDVLYIKFIF